MGYDRYKLVRNNEVLQIMPRVRIKSRTTDKFVVYNSSKTRLDRIAADFYGDDTFYWIILLANPEYYLEFDIPNNTVIRVPAPFQEVLSEVQKKILSLKNK